MRVRLSVMAVAGGLVCAVAAPSAAAARHSPWTKVGGPSTVGLSIDAMTAVSAHDAWAVGALHPGGHPNAKPRAVVMRWHRQRWQAASAPHAAQQLTSISARSAGDLWAGGYRNDVFGPTRVWHFAHHHWSTVPSRGLPPGITGKVITNNSHVWLVGEVDPGRRIEGAVIATYHPGKRRWSVDDLSRSGGFVAGATIGSTRAWAVGSTSKYDALGHPVIASWNGHRWSMQTFPHVRGQLTSVAAHSGHEAVAVGYNGQTTPNNNFSHAEGGIAFTWNGALPRQLHRSRARAAS
jgi:hypothetical protein